MLWDALQTGFVWVLRFNYACNALEVACKFGQPGRAVGLCFWCMQFWGDCMLWDSLQTWFVWVVAKHATCWRLHVSLESLVAWSACAILC